MHNSVTVQPDDVDGMERMARYLLHAPLNLDRMHFDQDHNTVAYRSKHQRRNSPGTLYDPLDFLARLLMHIPEPRLHTIRYTGAYSSVSRARRRAALPNEHHPGTATVGDDAPSTPERRRLRRQWAQMIRRIFEVDPLICDCGETMRIISFITNPTAINKILDHLDSKGRRPPRAPPKALSSHQKLAS